MILKGVFSNDEAKEEFNKIKEIEKNVDKEKLFYKSNKKKYNFKHFQTIRTFGEDIYNGEITLEEADNNQSNLLNEIKNFKYKTEPKSDKKRQEKENVEKNLYNFYEGREMVLMPLKLKHF